MDLTFSPEQQELAAAVRRFCAEQVTAERLGAWERDPDGIDPGSWAAVSALGWLGLGLPAAAGGSGLGLVEVACLLAECARGLVPSAVACAIRAAYALAHLAPDAPELPALGRGTQRLALALDDEAGGPPTHLDGQGSVPGLHGEKWYVPHGTRTDLFLVAARTGSESALVLVERAAVEVAPLRSVVSHEPQSILRFTGAPIMRRLTPAGAGDAALDRMRRHQVALALAEMTGGMDAVLERTVAYVKDREQFGQKIGAFQAVQHQIADMATAHTAARHLAWQAITRVAAGREDPIHLPAAAAFVGQAFKRLTLTAHHLHGGAGYVLEHPLHYYSERAQSLCIRYTPEADALEAVAALLLD